MINSCVVAARSSLEPVGIIVAVAGRPTSVGVEADEVDVGVVERVVGLGPRGEAAGLACRREVEDVVVGAGLVAESAVASWLPSVGHSTVLRRVSGYMSKTAAWYSASGCRSGRRCRPSISTRSAWAPPLRDSKASRTARALLSAVPESPSTQMRVGRSSQRADGSRSSILDRRRRSRCRCRRSSNTSYRSPSP